MQLGKRKIIDDSFSAAEKYLEIANADEAAAVALCEKRLFNQSGYFFIQSMEKHIKYCIAKKVNVKNPHFADELRTCCSKSARATTNRCSTS